MAIEVIAFDVNETLLDLSSLADHFDAYCPQTRCRRSSPRRPRTSTSHQRCGSTSTRSVWSSPTRGTSLARWRQPPGTPSPVQQRYVAFLSKFATLATTAVVDAVWLNGALGGHTHDLSGWPVDSLAR